MVVHLNFDAHIELKTTVYETYLKFTFFLQRIFSSHLLLKVLLEFLYELSLKLVSFLSLCTCYFFGVYNITNYKPSSVCKGGIEFQITEWVNNEVYTVSGCHLIEFEYLNSQFGI